ncbi:methylmalonic aciduria and homocystinuria type D protein [Tribonema minus]|uniref:Methylmalonic aciduria and homocystinuria type D protein n=1 Tax=Tribonema minus TaxID=303371 RepID=A0A835Z3S3_9STRA|nr:methylmalonic aciduria and homocystinuria type D protein [Tribonema minus]
MQVSVHTCPRALQRELTHVFRGTGVDLTGCLAVPTNQKAGTDLVNMGSDVDIEKDRLLNVFVDFAAWLCSTLREQGFWADYIDPCSGLPMLSGGNKVYSEVEGMQLLLQYQVMNAGMCRVLLHPTWGSHVYPASCFTTAPIEAVERVLEGKYHDEFAEQETAT